MELLTAAQHPSLVGKPLPSFGGVPFSPEAFGSLVTSFLDADGPQMGSTGRRVDGFTPDLATGLHYFGNRLCPYANRAFLTLAEKGAVGKIDYVHIDLKAIKPVWYKEHVCPSGAVPCVVDEGAVLFESSVVMEYLSERFGSEGPCLMPVDPKLRALVRMFVKAADGSTPTLYAAIRNQDESLQPTKQAELAGVLSDWEARFAAARVVAGTAGPYFLGPEPCLADIAVLPFLVRFDVLLQVFRGSPPLLSESTTPMLLAMVNAFRGRPSFATTVPSPEFIAAAYYDFVGGNFPAPTMV